MGKRAKVKRLSVEQLTLMTFTPRLHMDALGCRCCMAGRLRNTPTPGVRCHVNGGDFDLCAECLARMAEVLDTQAIIEAPAPAYAQWMRDLRKEQPW